MKLIISFIFLMLVSNPDLSEVRKTYTDASKSKANADAFLAKMSGISSTDGNKVLVAYKGSSIALQGKFASKISEKKSNLKNGALLVEASIKSEPKNVELRMIRLSIQETLPIFIVSYRKNITEDKDFILAHFKELDNELKVYIKNFILLSDSFSEKEKEAVK